MKVGAGVRGWVRRGFGFFVDVLRICAMTIQYMKQGIVRIPGRAVRLKKVSRRELGEAIVSVPTLRVERWDEKGVVSEAQLSRRGGLLWLDTPEGPYMSMSPEAVDAAPELLGTLALDALGVPVSRTSDELLIFMEYEGRPVAFLSRPIMDDMFWLSYEIVFLEDASLLPHQWWRQDDKLVYRYATTGRECPAFAGCLDDENSRFRVRGSAYDL